MGFEFGRHPAADKSSRTKHVVAAGTSVWDAGSIPAASTILKIEQQTGTAAAARPGGQIKPHTDLFNLPFVQGLGWAGLVDRRAFSGNLVAHER